MEQRQVRQSLTRRRGHWSAHRMPVVSPCILVVVSANCANAAKRLVPCGFAPVRSVANRAHGPRIRIDRRRCASWKSSRRACFRGIRRFRMGHSTEGGLPADIPMREARARRSDSVSGQTEVCRVCDLHPVRGVADSEAGMVRILCVPSPETAPIHCQDAIFEGTQHTTAKDGS